MCTVTSALSGAGLTRNGAISYKILFRGVFEYTGPGTWSVVSLGVGVLGCGDTPVNVS